MTLQQYIDKYNGHPIDWDGVYGPQCFDLYRQYCKEVLEVPQSPPTGSQGAKVIWTNYLQGYFDAIPNSPLNSPQKGDIVIWGTDIGPYGHVAVCITGGVMSLLSFDQNWAGMQYCTTVKHSYKGVLGWLRRKPPVVLDTIPNAPAESPVSPPNAPTSLPEPIPATDTSVDNLQPVPVKQSWITKVIYWLLSLLTTRR